MKKGGLKQRISNAFYENTNMNIQFKFLIGFIIFFFASVISAADINGRFLVTSADSSKLAVLLQVNTMTGTKALGGATIVIGFDTTSIDITTNPIKNTDYLFHNFCGNYYSPATITKPMKGRIWINIDLPFSNSNQGTLVSDTSGWTDVVTVYFDITNANGLARLYWLSTSPFWGIYDDDNLTLLQPNFFQNLIYTYDVTSPQLVTASLQDSDILELEFTEQLDSTSALNISNYSIDNGINILSIQSSAHLNKVIINTTEHAFGQQYTITVNNVYDLSGNIISTNHNAAGYALPPNTVEGENIPTEFRLLQNYPNPFNPSTKIKWQTPIGSHQSIKVYDVLGNEVATLIDEFKLAGSYEVDFNSKNLASGVYIYQLRTIPPLGSGHAYTETKKMVLLR